MMDAAWWYDLARRDRRRAQRFLLLHDAEGLARLAAVCADYLSSQYGLPLSATDVLATWQRVGLLHTCPSAGDQERAVGA